MKSRFSGQFLAVLSCSVCVLKHWSVWMLVIDGQRLSDVCQNQPVFSSYLFLKSFASQSAGDSAAFHIICVCLSLLWLLHLNPSLIIGKSLWIWDLDSNLNQEVNRVKNDMINKSFFNYFNTERISTLLFELHKIQHNFF